MNTSRLGRYDVIMMYSDSLSWCHDNEIEKRDRLTDRPRHASSRVAFATKKSNNKIWVGVDRTIIDFETEILEFFYKISLYKDMYNV